MLSEKELREHFNMPLNEVAKKFGMCTTALKKLCRKYGVMQWPHRKLRSLEKKIASLRAEQRYTTDGHGTLDDEIRKLEQQREALITGNGEAMDDGGAWSPTAGEPDDEGVDAEQFISGSGYQTPTGADMKKMDARLLNGHASVLKDSAKPSLGRSGSASGKPLGPGGSSNGNDAHTKTLAEENASLRALSRALMTERQELMSKLSASSAEVSNLRNLCNQLQSQVMLLDRNRGGEDGGIDLNGFKTEAQDDYSNNGMHEENAHFNQHNGANEKLFPGRGGSATTVTQQVLGMEQGDSNDMNSLAWMAPDFELDDLL